MSNNKRWAVVVLYTLVILATLPFARSAWNWIGAQRGYFVLIALYCGTAGYIYFRYKNLFIIGAIFLLSAAIFRVIPLPIERIHFIEYGLLGWLVWWAQGRGKRAIAVALAYILAIGVLDEVIQGILPNRVYDIRDIWMNVTGGCIGIGLCAIKIKTSL